MSKSPNPLQGHVMPEAEIDALLESTGVGVLSFANGDTPYGIPISFGYDGDDRLYFLLVGHSEEGKKVRYAEAATEASFLVYEVDSDTAWRSAIVSGSFERIDYDEWARAREAMAANAYRPDLLTDVDPASDPRVWRLEATDKSGRKLGAD